MKHESNCFFLETGRYTLGCNKCLKLAQDFLSDVDGEIVVSFPRRDAAAELGRKGGSAKSDAKAAAARNNGKLGGRPKKSK